mmetsp:Transcript_4472/g.16047  ORF Transcript_4472/g.16047 Transcript_4472/m.16047 type:complete len:157 (+) Transcript_4472:83-553(+)
MSMNASSRVCLGSKSAVATRPRVRVSARSLAPRARIAANKMIRCDWLSEHLNSGGFIGSRENIAVCTGTFIMLFAVRNGWAPSTSKNAKLEKGLNLEDSGSDMLSGDPLGKCDEARRNLRCPLERWGRPPERMVGSVPASDAGSGPRFDGWESWED